LGKYLANLYAGAVLLLITGRIGILHKYYHLAVTGTACHII